MFNVLDQSRTFQSRKDVSSAAAVVAVAGDRPSEAGYEALKVSRRHLSGLMLGILAYIDGTDGVDRGELVEYIFALPRRYRGYFTDPCMSRNKKRKYERRYRCAQPALTRSLKKLESRGLVRLVRHGRYVKQVHLTHRGRVLIDLIKNQKGAGR